MYHLYLHLYYIYTTYSLYHLCLMCKAPMLRSQDLLQAAMSMGATAQQLRSAQELLRSWRQGEAQARPEKKPWEKRGKRLENCGKFTRMKVCPIKTSMFES